MSHLKQTDPQLYEILTREESREHNTLELIASENFVSYSVLETAGGVMTNKYAEGYPGKRYYGGCEHVDEAEDLARDRAKELFHADYANVQPHSGSQANMAALMTFVNVGDTIMGLDLAHGGLDMPRVGVGHGLDRNGCPPTNRDRSDMNPARFFLSSALISYRCHSNHPRCLLKP